MPSDYLKSLQQQADEAGRAALSPPGDYMEALRSQADEIGRAQFGANVSQALTTNPDVYAKQRQAAARVGVAPAVAEALPAEVDARDRFRQIERNTEGAPALRLKYTDADFAKLAHDDSGPLSMLETAISKAARYITSADDGAGLIKDVAATPAMMSAGAAGLFRGAFDTAAVMLRPLVNAGTMNYNPLQDVADWFGEKGAEAAATAKRISPAMGGIIGGGVQSGIQSAAQSMGTAGMLLAVAAPEIAIPMALLAQAANQGGQSYNKARDKGADVGRSLIYGASDAMAEWVTEKFMGLGGFLEKAVAGASASKLAMYEISKELPGELAATTWQNFNEWATLNPEKSIRDFLAEQPEALAQTVVAVIVGGGAQIGAARAGQRVMENAAGRKDQAEQADRGSQAMTELATLAEASKLRERAPDQFATFAQSLADEHVPALYVEAKALAESGVDLQALGQALPSVAAQFNQALQQGGDVVIPTGEFLTAGQEFAQPLLEHARTGVEAMSPAEAKVYMQEHGDALQAEIAKVLAEKQGDDAFQASRDEVTTNFVSQLQGAGRTPEVAKAEGAALGSFFAVQAARLGITPTEMAARYPLRIQGKLAEGATQYDQPGSPKFDAWFGDSKVVDAQGTDFVPTDAHMAQLAERVRLAAYEADDGSTVLASKALSTEGRYGGVERSLDLEVIAREGYDPTALWAEMLRQAQAARQDSTFLSRVLRDDEDVDPLRHRPGVEIYFREAAQAAQLEQVLADLAKEGVEFLTVVVDGRRMPGAVAGEMPPAVGVRLQYVPEFDQRYGFDELSTLTDEALASKIRAKAREMKDLAARVAAAVEGVAFAGQFWHETQVAFSHQYQEKLDAIATGDAEAGSAGARGQAWVGESVRAGLEGADRQAREAAGGQPDGGTDQAVGGDARGANAQVLEQSGFDRFVGDAARVDLGDAHEFIGGEPVVVAALHGTTGDFTTFDRAFANPESDLGAGFYATNSTGDVGTNYAGEGPDLTNKIQRTAEQIASETDREYDDPEVLAEAKARFKANDGLAMPVWVKFDNPVVLGGRGETRLTYEESYDEETDEYGEPTGTLLDFADGLRQAMGDFNAEDEADGPIGNLMEEAADGDVTASRVIEIIKANEAMWDVTDDSGNSVSSEVIRRAFEYAGFDGFIDTTVNEKFGDARKLGKGMAGVDMDTVHFIAFKPTQIKSRLGNDGTFDEGDPNILSQQARGQIALGADITSTPSIITLLQGADLSTFTHEAGHFYLEVLTDLAAKIEAQQRQGASIEPGEAEILADAQKLLAWFGIQDTPELSALTQWFAMSAEEKRPHHETFARGFEAYAFEGRAPSVELQGPFQKFRAWMLSVYKQLKALNVTLTDEVRGVMDRMLATTEQIQTAEAARNMGALFQTAEQAGMTPEQWAAYQGLALDATQTAIDNLQAKGLKDMQWLQNARGRKLKEMQRRADGLRREVRQEARAEVMSKPVYRAWAFLTGKDSAAVDEGPTEAQTAYRQDLADWEQKRKEFVETATAAERLRMWEASPESKAPNVTPLAKGQFISKHRRAIAANVEVEALEWEGEHPKPEKPEVVRVESATPMEYSAGKLNTATLKERYGNKTDAVWRKLSALRMTSEANGIDPDVVAETFGFQSGDEMIQALAAAQPPKEAVEAMVDQRMLERHGDLATPEGLERATDEALHSDARSRFIATELQALQQAASVREKIPGKRNTVDVMQRAAREYAAGVIARLKVRDLHPSQYLASEARAARQAARAAKAGDIKAATQAKQTQLIQSEAAKQAFAAQAEIEKAAAYFRRFDKRLKTIDIGYQDQIEQLLVAFSFRSSESLRAIDKRKSLVEWVESQREQGLEPEIPDGLLQAAQVKSYKDMTVEEVRGLRDTIKQIEHLGRLKNKLLTAKAARDFEAVRDEIVDGIEAHSQGRVADTRTPPTKGGRWLQSVRRFGAAHVKVATWARIFDGGKDGGPVWEYFVRTANDRGNMESTMRAEATQELAGILAPLMASAKLGGKGQHFPSIGRSMNREQVLAMALNMGNAGNIQRMLGGEGWTIQQIQPVLRTLSAADWQAVQAVWDHFEAYRPLIAAKERRVYGKEPNWVDPQPLTAQTSDGSLVTVRGGYYPIKYDPLANNRAEQHSDAESAKRQLQGAYTSATTRRGFTKARAEEINGRPLLYSLQGVYSGVNDVIHDLAWHEWLIDVNKLLKSDKVDEAIRSHYGPDVVRQFKTWVQDIAEGDKGLQVELDGALSRLRHGVSIAGLGFNVMSAVMQPLGLTQSIVRVGAAHIARGVAQYIAHPLDTTKRVNEASEFMAGRSRTRFRELAELRNQVEGQHPVREVIGRYAYFLMMRFQQAVDVPTWLGAYDKAVGEGNGDERAAAMADQAVIDAQGGGATKDLSSIERGGPAQKLFTVFYSFMNTALNIGVGQGMTSAHTAKGRAKLASDMLLLYSIPAVLGVLLKDALVPGDAGDDPEHLVKKLLAAQLDYLLSLFAVVREFTAAGKAVTGLEDHVRDYSGPAGMRVAADAVTLGKQVQQGEFDDSFRKAFINTLGGVFGLPSAQVNRTITGVKALNEGKTSNPAAVVFGYQDPH